MPDDDSTSTTASSQRGWSSIFALPGPLRRLFSHFPLVTYQSNLLPARSRSTSSSHALYIFSTPSDASSGLPSLNPTCLKHQTYLLLRDISIILIPATNHASPSGALPFLLTSDQTPIPSSRLRRWTDDASSTPSSSDPALEVHAALLEHRLRRAWLAQLYLDPANAAVMQKIYTDPVSRAAPVRFVLSQQLRRAAAEELGKTKGFYFGSAIEDAEVVIQGGREALVALESLLQERGGEWFEQGGAPGWFDAAVFAYTGPLLDRRMDWARNGLGPGLMELSGLMGHRKRVAERCGWEIQMAST